MIEPATLRRATFGAFAALLLAAASVHAEPFRLVGPFPAAPTWHDPVTFRVEGEVSGGCGAAVGEPAVVPPSHFRVPVWVDCTIPTGDFQPVSFPVELGRLAPGSYTVGLDAAGPSDGAVLFEVHEVARIAIGVPPRSTPASPGSLTLALLGQTVPAAVLEVGAGVVQVLLGPSGAPERLLELSLPLPALAPGAYEVRALMPADAGVTALARGLLQVTADGRCAADAATLCLRDGRFRVRASWRDFDARRGEAGAAPIAGQEGSGLLWFFAPDNAELTVKVLDGCAVNGHWWVFLASGSTVAYEVEVTDTVTGARARYANPLGASPPLVADTSALPGCAAP